MSFEALISFQFRLPEKWPDDGQSLLCCLTPPRWAEVWTDSDGLWSLHLLLYYLSVWVTSGLKELTFNMHEFKYRPDILWYFSFPWKLAFDIIFISSPVKCRSDIFNEMTDYLVLNLKCLDLNHYHTYWSYNFCMFVLLPTDVPETGWIWGGKQCKPWSDATVCGIWSGSKLCA